MVAEDALAAAKSAAIRDLLSRSTLDNLPITHPENGSKYPSPRKTRRRRRKRPQAFQHPPAPQEPQQTGVEYVPEPLDQLTSVVQENADKQNVSAVKQIVSAINRFAEMGPDAPEIDTSINEDGATPSVPTDTQHNISGYNDQPTIEGGSKEDGQQNPDGAPRQPLSRKKQKEQRRSLIARLKEISERPELVESWDINSPDPILLVHLKAYPNSVPVPINWSQKRKYLQNKRGMEKRPFQLPAYIIDTGVGALRDAQIEADEKKTLKQRQRETMRAKTGRGIEIDSQRLHDAFFKFQTKPRLTKHGEVYYELRELETDDSQFTPGFLSEELRAALGITVNDPPPWLINMQRYGPPPSYPELKIPAVNAPIPPGARFGYQVGGWGKPPVDPSGRPIYGDVFAEGLSYGGEDPAFEMPQAEKDYLWGEIRSAPSSITIRAEDVNSDEDDEGDETNKQVTTGWTPTQLPTTNEASRHDADEVQKTQRKEQESDTEVRKGIADGKLFTVLGERKVSVGSAGMMGSTHIYEMENPRQTETSADDGDGSGARREEVAGRVSNKEAGLDKRKRELTEDENKHGRSMKKQKEFKF